MPKKNRLSGVEFRNLLKKRPKRVHGTYFSLAIYSAPADEAVKIGFTIPKKTTPKATSRNLVERRCKAIMRNKVKNLPKGLTLVFHAKRDAANIPYKDTQKDLLGLLSSVE